MIDRGWFPVDGEPVWVKSPERLDWLILILLSPTMPTPQRLKGKGLATAVLSGMLTWKVITSFVVPDEMTIDC